MNGPPQSQAILLAEDNADDVLLIRLALEKAGSADLLRVVRDGEEVLHYLQGEGAFADRIQFPVPDLLLLDLAMPRMSGLDATQHLRQKAPKVKVLLLTLHKDRESILRVIQAGADGYVSKQDSIDEVVGAIHAVHKGRPFFSPELTKAAMRQLSQNGGKDGPVERLTPR